MKTLRNAMCAAIGLAALVATPARGASPAEVEQAIKNGKEFIYAQMKGNNWETVPAPQANAQSYEVTGKQWGGMSALAVYTLLAAGENPQEKRLVPAIEFVKNAKLVGNYALGLRAQIWMFLPDNKENRALLRQDTEQLLRGVFQKPSSNVRPGFYAYWTNAKGPAEDRYDLSVSQFGVLGMWACEQAGAEVPLAYWQLVDTAWKNAEQKVGNDMGGWAYMNIPGQAVRGNMTAAGIATLYITQDYLLQNQQWNRCEGGTINPNLVAGLNWMDHNIKEMLKGQADFGFYGMYGVERIGVASGRKYFGSTDWYAVGADHLLQVRQAGRGWYNDVPQTCFATLFLTRGRAPLVMNKLEYEVADAKNRKTVEPWNERPRDVANFARWAGKQTEKYLNWQLVNIKVSPDDLHDAPILYISGSERLNFTAPEIDRLRTFVENGGLILGNADCGKDAFSRSFKELGNKLFKYEFRNLPASHPIYINEQFRPTKWKLKPPQLQVLGMSNGVRELMILIPEADLSRAFQTNSFKTKEDLFQLAQDIFLYSVDKENLRYRGETYIVKRNEGVSAQWSVKLARLQVGDNWDPEPGGWRRLSAIVHNLYKVDIEPIVVRLGAGKLADFKFAHLTGTTKFTLTAAQQEELKQFMAAGGTLVVDAAGGSTEFADAAENELAPLVGASRGAIGEIVPPGNTLFVDCGPKIDTVAYRQFARGKVSGKMNVPRLRAVTQNGRMVLIFSREDLSAGLVGEPMDGILGYDPASATALMRNIVLYAGIKAAKAVGGEQPTTQPATTQPAKTP
jgi:hypothetical protein